MKITKNGIINPAAPGTRRALCTFPSVACLPNGKILACYRVGSTKDCEDETIELRESSDLGTTWSDPWTPFPSFGIDGRRCSLKVIYLAPLAGGRLFATGMAVDRSSYPGKPLFNEATQGCLPTWIIVSESHDNGRTWESWRAVDTPEDIGPPSLTSNLLQLADGRLAISVESNKHYFDASPWLQKVTYVYSSDGGRTWGNPVVVYRDPSGRIFNWDQRAGVTPDGAVVTFTWVYDSLGGEYRNIRRRYSLDGGCSWTEPEDLGFADQPSRPAIFNDSRVVLAWVDRFRSGSIRARAADSFRDPFPDSTEVVLYRSQAKSGSDQTSLSETLDEMSRWAYGLPYAEPLPNGEAMVVYYAGTPLATDICWARLSLA